MKPRKRGGYSPLEGCKIQPQVGVVAPGEKIALYMFRIDELFIIRRYFTVYAA